MKKQFTLLFLCAAGLYSSLSAMASDEAKQLKNEISELKRAIQLEKSMFEDVIDEREAQKCRRSTKKHLAASPPQPNNAIGMQLIALNEKLQGFLEYEFTDADFNANKKTICETKLRIIALEKERYEKELELLSLCNPEMHANEEDNGDASQA